jgi:hypothetical protein
VPGERTNVVTLGKDNTCAPNITPYIHAGAEAPRSKVHVSDINSCYLRTIYMRHARTY